METRAFFHVKVQQSGFVSVMVEAVMRLTGKLLILLRHKRGW